jgi:hypothetical protein
MLLAESMKTGEFAALVAVVSPVRPRAFGSHSESVDALLDGLDSIDRMQNRAAAAKVAFVDRLRRRMVAESGSRNRSLDERAFTAEIATLMRLSERGAQNLIGTSRSLVESLPATLDSLAAGDISWRHAQIMVEQIAGLDAESVAALEAKVLPSASTSTPLRFASTVRKQRERLHPETIAARHEAAREERTVVVEEDRDGMVWIMNKTDAATGLAIHDKLTTAALALRKQGDQRTLAQLRSDIHAAIMLATDGSEFGDVANGIAPALEDTDAFVRWFAGIKAEVIVSVPLLSLLGQSDEPATLEGYGPIDLETARSIAGRATSFVRILTHPETGVTLSVGRKRYKVPKDLKTWLRVRDGTCRFPNCNRQAKRCDIDHSREWQDFGETAHDNLAHLCRSHHTVKGSGKWKVDHSTDGSGVLTWTSPAGRTYVTRPATNLSVPELVEGR